MTNGSFSASLATVLPFTIGQSSPRADLSSLATRIGFESRRQMTAVNGRDTPGRQRPVLAALL